MSIGWAILGTGGFPEDKVAPAMKLAEGSELVAVLSRDLARANEFAGKHGALIGYDSIETVLNDLRVEVAARYEAAVELLRTGELEQARQHAVAMLEGAERLRDRHWLSSALRVNGYLCYSIGDWTAARDFTERGLAVLPGDPRNLAPRAVGEFRWATLNRGACTWSGSLRSCA